MALLGPLGLSSCPDINIGMVAYGRVPQSCAKAYVRLPSRSRQEAVGQKQCFCLIHLWIHKKSLLLASTRRQVGVSRSNEINVFFKNWQMYGAKWQLFWFEHGIGLFFCEKKEYLFRSVFVSIFFLTWVAFWIPFGIHFEAFSLRVLELRVSIICSSF